MVVNTMPIFNMRFKNYVLVCLMSMREKIVETTIKKNRTDVHKDKYSILMNNPNVSNVYHALQTFSRAPKVIY